MQIPYNGKESVIQGTLYVTFVIEHDGSITDVKILPEIGGGCNEEALRVIRNILRLEPGKQRGNPARVQFNMPLNPTCAL